jgi:hypothetical protein
MDGEEQRRRRDSPWLSWALVLSAAAGALWLASLSLEGRLPPLPEEPARPPVAASEARRELLAAAPVDPAPAPPPTALEPPHSEDPSPAAPPALRPEEAPPAPIGEPPRASPPAPADTFLRNTIGRQLAMNDLRDVRVEIAGDRVITSGWLVDAGERARVRLLVRSLAPELIHEDRTAVSRAGARR